MIRFIASASLVAAAHSAQAENRRLSGAEIAALLPTVVAVSEDTRQVFSASGGTTYTNQGRDSYGSWWVADDQYCSRWPPAGGFACYDVHLDDAPADGGAPILRWVGDSGRPTINRLEDK